MWVIEDAIRQKTEEKCRESVESRTRDLTGKRKREGSRVEGGGDI